MPTRVDYKLSARYTPRFSLLLRQLARLTPMTAVILLACAARSGTGSAPLDPGAESRLIEANTPTSPLRVVFEWEAREREGRFNGAGVARLVAPNARLDLFGPRGESYLSAAISDGQLHLPPNAATGIIPPPALLWGAVGVFQPPAGGILESTIQERNGLELVYRTDDGFWTFQFRQDRLQRVELKDRDGARKTIELKGEGTAGLPRETIYRDWAAFTELKMKLGEVEEVGSFPPETWQLHAR